MLAVLGEQVRVVGRVELEDLLVDGLGRPEEGHFGPARHDLCDERHSTGLLGGLGGCDTALV